MSEHIWTFTCPDGKQMRTSLPETIATKLDLLEHWYLTQISPFKMQKAIAEYEIVTGEKFKED